jgi:hypothetical protein
VIFEDLGGGTVRLLLQCVDLRLKHLVLGNALLKYDGFISDIGEMFHRHRDRKGTIYMALLIT